MSPLFTLFLFLHIVAAIVAFGPTFAFPLIAAAGQQNRQHAAFAAEVNEKIEEKLVLPLALSMPVTGAGMIIFGGINLFQFWLIAAIIVYVIAISYSIFIQGPAGKELALLLANMPAPSPGPGAALAEPAAAPPARLMELGSQMQRGGMILTVLLVVILFLMIVRPAF